MEYTDDECLYLMNNFHEAEARAEAEAEAFYDSKEFLESLSVPISFEDLKFSENQEIFETVIDLIANKSVLTLEFGLDKGSPYYKIPDKRILYLNKEIVAYIYNWLEKGITDSKIPTDFKGLNNKDESYMLRLLQHDSKNNVATYSPQEGYKAKYPGGTILYGQADCTPDQMRVKLEPYQ